VQRDRPLGDGSCTDNGHDFESSLCAPYSHAYGKAVRLFIFGAGSTIGTLGLPGVDRFGLELARRIPEWRSKFWGLAAVVDALEPKPGRSSPNDWNLDTAWTHVDYIAKLHRALDTMHFPGTASHNLHAALVAVYGDVELDRIRRAYDRRRRFKLRKIIDDVKKGDVVVSFNWDVLVEGLLLHRLSKSPAFRLVQTPHVGFEDSVQFAKPHGSLAWNRYAIDAIDDGGAPKLGPIPKPEDVLWTEHEPDRAKKKEPLLLGAVPMKSELIREVDDLQHHVVMAQWATLLRAITAATEVVVVGYGFPPEDSYGRFLMRQAAQRRRRPITHVQLYEVRSQTRAVRKAIADVLGVKADDIDGKGKVDRCP
jgi:hypothetical protein